MSELITLRLEVEHMKLSIQRALSLYATDLTDAIQEAVEKKCNSDELAQVMYREVDRVIEEAVKNEIERFYRYGDGREAIKEAVRVKLTQGA